MEEYKDAIQLSMRYKIALSVYFPPILIAKNIYVYTHTHTHTHIYIFHEVKQNKSLTHLVNLCSEYENLI